MTRIEKHEDPISGVFWIALTVVLFAVIILVQGCNLFHNQIKRPVTGKERKMMEPSRQTTTRQVDLPPIDAAAPLRVETATFALG